MHIVKTRLYLSYILLPLLIPHLIFYFFSSKKNLIKSDVGGENLIYHLVYDKPFRNVFYYRIGKKHFLFSWLLPRCSYTKISQKMIVGKDLYIEHGFNTFLNANKIGDHFR